MDEQNQQGYSKDKILTEVQRLLQSIESMYRTKKY